jgi:hypothetical protein
MSSFVDVVLAIHIHPTTKLTHHTFWVSIVFGENNIWKDFGDFGGGSSVADSTAWNSRLAETISVSPKGFYVNDSGGPGWSLHRFRLDGRVLALAAEPDGIPARQPVRKNRPAGKPTLLILLLVCVAWLLPNGSISPYTINIPFLAWEG